MRAGVFLASAMLVAAIGAAGAEPQAAEPEQLAVACRRLIVIPNVKETVESNITVAARLKFPAEVKTFELTTPGLWEAGNKLDSVWVRPTDTNTISATVGLTVFLVDGRQYDFTVKRTDDPKRSRCVVVTDPPPSSSEKNDERARAEAAQSAQTISALTGRIREMEKQQKALIAQMRRQVEQQATDRIKAFQQAINVKYSVNVEKGGPETRRLIDAVYDDGRFTYIRLSTTSFGVPTITAKLNGNAAELEATYEDLTGVYTITGLFDRLQVKLDSAVISIQREG